MASPSRPTTTASLRFCKWEHTGKDENGDGLSEGKGIGTHISVIGSFKGMQDTVELEAKYLTSYAPDKGTWSDAIITEVSNYTVGQ